jgi:hypothetical protein
MSDDYNILFRWFLDMNLDAPSLDATTFTKHRDRLLAHDVAVKFFDEGIGQARRAGLLSDEHFMVEGTLIEACASLKGFRPREEAPADRPVTDDDAGNPSVNFHGERRTNETHVSTTDPEARLMKKGCDPCEGRGKEAKLSYGAHALMENRHGLLRRLLS